jgi:hypothetical protein
MKAMLKWAVVAAAGMAGFAAAVMTVPAPEDRSVPVQAVDPGVFAAAGYDARRAVLTLVFRNGYAYEFLGVPPTLAAEFLASDSKGAYYNGNIRDLHTAVRIGGPVTARTP